MGLSQSHNIVQQITWVLGIKVLLSKTSGHI